MNEDNINDQANEPTENYAVSQPEVNSDEINPLLIELIEKSKEQHKQGLSFSHEEAMKMIKEKYDFLK